MTSTGSVAQRALLNHALQNRKVDFAPIHTLFTIHLSKIITVVDLALCV